MQISILALGKSGSNIANNWSDEIEDIYYINTHRAEMKLLPGDFFDSNIDYEKPLNKRLIPRKLCVDGRGTGRSPKTGRLLAENNSDDIEAFIDYNFNDYKGLILIVVGGGGGSGTGFAPVVAEKLSERGLSFGMIYTLPLTNEGIPTIPNAINGLSDILTNLDGKKISPFFLIDNELLMSEVGEGKEFWSPVNDRIKKIMLFASLVNRDITDVSGFNTLDEREFVRMFRLIKSNGKIGFNDIKSFPLDINDVTGSLRDGMKNTSMSFINGFDYVSSEGLLVAIEQPEEHGDDSGSFNELFDLIAKKYKGKRILKSVVPSDEYRVNILFSGLNTPTRIKKLNEMSSKLVKTGKKKRTDKVKTSNVKGFEDDFDDIEL